METLMQLIEALVNAETEDERMALVTDNKALIDNVTEAGAGNEELQNALDEAMLNGETLTQSLADAKQLYKDTFFGKKEIPNENEDEVEEEKEEVVQTLDEVLQEEKDLAKKEGK